MQTPYAESGVKPEITVLLSSTNDNKLKKFYCSICGKVVFEYYSVIRVIVPGKLEEMRSPVVIECRGSISIPAVNNDPYSYRDSINTRCHTRYWLS